MINSKEQRMAISKSLFLSIALCSTVLTAGCTANSASTETAKRFSSKTVGSDTVLTDSTTGLTWTNSAQGCKPLFGDDPAQTLTKATNFCADLSFAGHSDWRLATVKEMTELETKTDANGISLFYKNPKCARVLAVKSDKSLTSISTTNKGPAGRDVGNIYPAGTRCVRGK